MRAARKLGVIGLAAVSLFALPGCFFKPPRPQGNFFSPGPTPQSSVIYCDIEKVGSGWDHTSRVCADAASDDVRQSAVPLTSAALALNAGTTSMFALDKSAGAVSRCGADGEIVEFQGPYPQGTPQCINCGAQIGAGQTYPDANAACVALCQDISTDAAKAAGVNLSDAQIGTFCNDHTLASTNVPLTGCPMGFEGACTDAGTLRMDFTDPRPFPEPVLWGDPINVATGGTANNDLAQTAASSPDGSYVAGAVSTQLVTRGDAFVEFSTGEINKTHVIGFSHVGSAPQPDADPSPADIAYAFDLGNDGRVYILQAGTLVGGPGIGGSWDTYAQGERFRLRLLDRGDGTVDLSFSKVVVTCPAGMACNEVQYLHVTPALAGGFRVDTAFHDQGATLQNVVLMRIQ